jgi:hypothetical protein
MAPSTDIENRFKFLLMAVVDCLVLIGLTGILKFTDRATAWLSRKLGPTLGLTNITLHIIEYLFASIMILSVLGWLITDIKSIFQGEQ